MGQDANTKTGPKLRDSIQWSCIVAYKEDTRPLEKALVAEGFQPVIQRISYSDEEKQFSAVIRGMLNHKRAWEQASQIQGLSLIMEADFVPCRGLRDFAVPIPVSETHRSVAWLYLCAGRFRKRVEGQFFLGSSTSAVAYIVSPFAARSLLELAGQMLAKIDPRKYSQWDSNIWPFLRENDIPMFVALRNYGEHGGFSNPEHKQEAQQVIPHRAECLMGPLHFLPDYAQGRIARFIASRCFHKLKAFAKLVCGRTITPGTLRELGSARERFDLAAICLARLVSLY
jgi:hypothetical protein